MPIGYTDATQKEQEFGRFIFLNEKAKLNWVVNPLKDFLRTCQYFMDDELHCESKRHRRCYSFIALLPFTEI